MRVDIKVDLRDFNEAVGHLYDFTAQDLIDAVPAAVKKRTNVQVLQARRDGDVAVFRSNNFNSKDIRRLTNLFGDIAEKYNHAIFKDWTNGGDAPKDRVLGAILKGQKPNEIITVGLEYKND